MDDLAQIDRLAAICGELAAFLSAALPQSSDAKRWQAELAKLLDQLPETADRLRERLERLDELETDFAAALTTAKLDAMKEFAYGASHEINNPLANISARAQTLLQDERDPERRRRLAAINSQAFRAHEMIADLMLFARPPKMNRQPVELIGLIQTIVDAAAADAQAQHTQILFRPTEPQIAINADPVHLRVALGALLANSLEALNEGGLIEIDIRRSGSREAAKSAKALAGDFVTIVVADTGPGVPESARPHIFDPFFSGREAGRGLGMGLAKCWRIVTEHGGRIDLAPSEKGARFEISLSNG